ncbi:unnamed protein product, partial [Prorocentrum cordatum]
CWASRAALVATAGFASKSWSERAPGVVRGVAVSVPSWFPRRPFRGAENVFHLFHQITTTQPQWGLLPLPVQQLLQALIVKDPAARLSASGVCEHPWVLEGQAGTLSTHPLLGALPSTFGRGSHFQRAVMFCVATGLGAGTAPGQDMRRLSEAFQTLDVDHSGYLTIDEVEQMIIDMDVGLDAKQLVASLDMDKDGRLSFTEFLAGALRMEGEVFERLIRYAFSIIDRDGDGFISMQELGCLLSGDGLPTEVLPDGQTVEQIMEEASNGKGRLSFQEFRAYFQELEAAQALDVRHCQTARRSMLSSQPTADMLEELDVGLPGGLRPATTAGAASPAASAGSGEFPSFHAWLWDLFADTKEVASFGRLLTFTDSQLESAYVAHYLPATCKQSCLLGLCLLSYACWALLLEGLRPEAPPVAVWSPAVRAVNNAAWLVLGASGVVVMLRCGVFSAASKVDWLVSGQLEARAVMVELSLCLWGCAVPWISCCFANRFRVASLFGREGSDVFGTISVDYDLVIVMQGTLMFLCMRTHMRFACTLLIGTSCVLAYSLTSLVLGAALPSCAEEGLASHWAWLSLLLLLVTALGLLGHWSVERQRRVAFLSLYASYEVLQQAADGSREVDAIDLEGAPGSWTAGAATRSARLRRAQSLVCEFGESVEVFSRPLGRALQSVVRVLEDVRADVAHAERLQVVDLDEVLLLGRVDGRAREQLLELFSLPVPPHEQPRPEAADGRGRPSPACCPASEAGERWGWDTLSGSAESAARPLRLAADALLVPSAASAAQVSGGPGGAPVAEECARRFVRALLRAYAPSPRGAEARAALALRSAQWLSQRLGLWGLLEAWEQLAPRGGSNVQALLAAAAALHCGAGMGAGGPDDGALVGGEPLVVHAAAIGPALRALDTSGLAAAAVCAQPRVLRGLVRLLLVRAQPHCALEDIRRVRGLLEDRADRCLESMFSERVVMMSLVLVAADFSFLALPQSLHRHWTVLCQSEAPSDLDVTAWMRGLTDVLVLPLYQLLNSLAGRERQEAAAAPLKMLVKNCQAWRQVHLFGTRSQRADGASPGALCAAALSPSSHTAWRAPGDGGLETLEDLSDRLMSMGPSLTSHEDTAPVGTTRSEPPAGSAPSRRRARPAPLDELHGSGGPPGRPPGRGRSSGSGARPVGAHGAAPPAPLAPSPPSPPASPRCGPGVSPVSAACGRHATRPGVRTAVGPPAAAARPERPLAALASACLGDGPLNPFGAADCGSTGDRAARQPHLLHLSGAQAHVLRRASAAQASPQCVGAPLRSFRLERFIAPAAALGAWPPTLQRAMDFDFDDDYRDPLEETPLPPPAKPLGDYSAPKVGAGVEAAAAAVARSLAGRGAAVWGEREAEPGQGLGSEGLASPGAWASGGALGRASGRQGAARSCQHLHEAEPESEEAAVLPAPGPAEAVAGAAAVRGSGALREDARCAQGVCGGSGMSRECEVDSRRVLQGRAQMRVPRTAPASPALGGPPAAPLPELNEAAFVVTDAAVRSAEYDRLREWFASGRGFDEEALARCEPWFAEILMDKDPGAFCAACRSVAAHYAAVSARGGGEGAQPKVVQPVQWLPALGERLREDPTGPLPRAAAGPPERAAAAELVRAAAGCLGARRFWRLFRQQALAGEDIRVAGALQLLNACAERGVVAQAEVVDMLQEFDACILNSGGVAASSSLQALVTAMPSLRRGLPWAEAAGDGDEAAAAAATGVSPARTAAGESPQVHQPACILQVLAEAPRKTWKERLRCLEGLGALEADQLGGAALWPALALQCEDEHPAVTSAALHAAARLAVQLGAPGDLLAARLAKVVRARLRQSNGRAAEAAVAFLAALARGGVLGPRALAQFLAQALSCSKEQARSAASAAAAAALAEAEEGGPGAAGTPALPPALEALVQAAGASSRREARGPSSTPGSGCQSPLRLAAASTPPSRTRAPHVASPDPGAADVPPLPAYTPDRDCAARRRGHGSCKSPPGRTPAQTPSRYAHLTTPPDLRLLPRSPDESAALLPTTAGDDGGGTGAALASTPPRRSPPPGWASGSFAPSPESWRGPVPPPPPPLLAEGGPGAAAPGRSGAAAVPGEGALSRAARGDDRAGLAASSLAGPQLRAESRFMSSSRVHLSGATVRGSFQPPARASSLPPAAPPAAGGRAGAWASAAAPAEQVLRALAAWEAGEAVRDLADSVVRMLLEAAPRIPVASQPEIWRALTELRGAPWLQDHAVLELAVGHSLGFMEPRVVAAFLSQHVADGRMPAAVALDGCLERLQLHGRGAGGSRLANLLLALAQELCAAVPAGELLLPSATDASDRSASLPSLEAVVEAALDGRIAAAAMQPLRAALELLLERLPPSCAPEDCWPQLLRLLGLAGSGRSSGPRASPPECSPAALRAHASPAAPAWSTPASGPQVAPATPGPPAGPLPAAAAATAPAPAMGSPEVCGELAAVLGRVDRLTLELARAEGEEVGAKLRELAEVLRRPQWVVSLRAFLRRLLHCQRQRAAAKENSAPAPPAQKPGAACASAAEFLDDDYAGVREVYIGDGLAGAFPHSLLGHLKRLLRAPTAAETHRAAVDCLCASALACGPLLLRLVLRHFGGGLLRAAAARGPAQAVARATLTRLAALSDSPDPEAVEFRPRWLRLVWRALSQAACGRGSPGALDAGLLCEALRWLADDALRLPDAAIGASDSRDLLGLVASAAQHRGASGAAVRAVAARALQRLAIARCGEAYLQEDIQTHPGLSESARDAALSSLAQGAPLTPPAAPVQRFSWSPAGDARRLPVAPCTPGSAATAERPAARSPAGGVP